MANVYQMVTDRITAQLEQGNIPWRKPWTGVSADEGGAVNYVSRRPYSLINQLILGKPETKTIPLLRYYNVFHLDDVEGIESKITRGEAPKVQPLEAAEKAIADYLSRQPGLRFQNDKQSNSAYYSLPEDMVVVPMLSQYRIPEEYYSTTFHELTHSTIPESRCDRKAENFGNEEYSREELVAEIGSAMLCNRLGIESARAFKNSVAYIKSWLGALKNDPKMIIWAAGRAEKAAKFILNEF